MIEIFLTEPDVARLQHKLLGGDTELCAVGLAQMARGRQGVDRLLVREIIHPAAEDYSRRSAVEAELKPAFVAAVTKRAKRQDACLLFMHSHPGPNAPEFSPIDDFGEERLSRFLASRHPAEHTAVVVSEGGWCARLLGLKREIPLRSVGRDLKLLFAPHGLTGSNDGIYDRQIRALGPAGQAALERLRVAVVGLGGTGSIVTQNLAHLGIRKFLLIDPDTIEASNLNRLVNAHAADVGTPKVEVARRYISSLRPAAEVTAVQGDVTRASCAEHLLEADIVFGCTDSHGSRAVLQQVAYQYYIPCIDMGVVIAVAEGSLRHLFGRVQLLAPGLACLTCNELLNPEQVRRDMMTEFERKRDPYILGHHEPAPAVISFNATVASLATTMLLSMVTDLPAPARHLLYNVKTSALRTVHSDPLEDCIVCSPKGGLGRADSWPLLARRDDP